MFTLVICLGVNIVQLVVYIVAYAKVIRMGKERVKLQRKRVTSNGMVDGQFFPRVSIVKPIVGDEPKIKALMETYFQLDYPSYDLHFCFENASHSCIGFVQQLAIKYPKVKAFVHVKQLEELYENRKILNIAQACSDVKGELMWLVDEIIQVHPMSLREMVSCFEDSEVGFVHQLPLWKSRNSLDHAINLTYFSNNSSRFYLFCNDVGILCVSGMSIMFDVEKLKEIGGVSVFSRFLSEDYALMLAMTQRGYKARLAPSSAIQNPCAYNIRYFTNRMIRWTKLRINIVFFATFFEPLVFPLCHSIVTATCLSILIGLKFYLGFIICLVACFSADQIFMNLLENVFPEQGPLPSLMVRIQAFLVLQILIVPYVWFMVVLQPRTIRWHTTVYNIGRNTLILKPEKLKKKRWCSTGE